MIDDGQRICHQCGTVLEFDIGQLVEVRGASPCLGCERWIAILERATVLALEKPEPMDLSPAANLERLRQGRQPVPAFDHARAAANDRE